MPHITVDGRSMVFSRKDGIYRANADGTDAVLLVKNESTFFASLSPDGRTLMFTSLAAGIQTLWTVPLAGGATKELIHEFIFGPSFSPDGRRIVLGTSMSSGMVCEMPDCTNRVKLPLPPLDARWSGHRVRAYRRAIEHLDSAARWPVKAAADDVHGSRDHELCVVAGR